MSSKSKPSMDTIVRDAWIEGQRFDLTGIGYGRIHWGNYRDISNTPFPYYQFLAGLVRLTQSKHICEIGTHSGGSARSMLQGMLNPDGGLIVTIDVSRESNKYLKKYKNIRKIRGDANAKKMVSKIINELDVRKIDLLFIDANHNLIDTLMNYSIYSIIFKPDFVILDDINLNESMQELWAHLKSITPNEDIIYAVDVVPKIRSVNVGFGLLRLNYEKT